MNAEPNDAVIVEFIQRISSGHIIYSGKNLIDSPSCVWGTWHRYEGLAFVVDKFSDTSYWYIVLLVDGTLARCVSGDLKKV